MTDTLGEFVMDDTEFLLSKSDAEVLRHNETSQGEVKPFIWIGKIEKQNSKAEQATEDGLDDVDGAMFSRQSKYQNEPVYRHHEGCGTLASVMFRRSHQEESKESKDGVLFDDTDGEMFSRTSVRSASLKRPTPLDISGTKFRNGIGRQVPRSPSADFIHNARLVQLSDNFPFKPFSSAANLTQHVRAGSDSTDFGFDSLPGNFDSLNASSNAGLNNSLNTLSLDQNDGKSFTGGDDVSDSALFNRGNSFKNKDDITNTGKVELEEVVNPNKNILKKDSCLCKSLPDMRDHVYVGPASVSSDSELKETIERKPRRASLPNYLDADLNPKLVGDVLHRGNENEIPVIEIMEKKEFIPLTRYPENNGCMASPDSEAEKRLLPEAKPGQRKPFRWKYFGTVIFPAVSVLLFLADIGTDINLALTYKADGEKVFFIVTVLCIILPSILMSIVDISWIYVDKDIVNEDREDENTYYNTNGWKICRIIMGVLSFGRVVRTISHIYHSLRSKLYGEEYHKQRKIEERRDYCMLDVINAFTESCLQLIAQMVLLYRYRHPFSADLGFSIVCSWLSIGWAYSCYYRYQKEAMQGRKDVNFFGIMVFCFAVLSALATRICCISLFLVYYPSWIGAVVIFLHFLVMLVWIAFCQKPNLEGLSSSKVGRVLYYLFFAYLSIMYFVNLKDNRSRFRLLVYFVIYYLENSTAAGFLLWKTSFDYSKSVMEFRWSLIIVPLGMFFHILFLLIFYRCFHPMSTRSRRNQSVVYTSV